MFSVRSLPLNKKLIRTGVSVIAKKASTIRIKDFVQANGLNNLPSIPVSKNTGKNDAITIIVEEDESDYDLSTEMKSVLDDRLLEDEKTYLSAEESINQLNKKYDL